MIADIFENTLLNTFNVNKIEITDISNANLDRLLRYAIEYDLTPVKIFDSTMVTEEGLVLILVNEGADGSGLAMYILDFKQEDGVNDAVQKCLGTDMKALEISLNRKLAPLSDKIINTFNKYGGYRVIGSYMYIVKDGDKLTRSKLTSINTIIADLQTK